MEEEVDFFDMLKLVLEGAKMKRNVWQDKKAYVFMNNDRLTLQKTDGLHDWIISKEDMESGDWIHFEHEGAVVFH